MWPFTKRKQTIQTPIELASDKEKQPSDSFLTLPEVDLELTDSVYPPPDAPLSAIGTEAVLRSQAKLIRELMWAVTMDIEDKDRYLLPVIKNVAAFVHLLPASQSHHHNGRGGLFRHSLETAFYAVNIAKNRLLDVNANPSDTYHNQSRWFLAIAIAGLMHDLGKCLTDMTVSSPSTINVWLPTIETLTAWLERNHVHDYYCAWNLNRIHRQHECATAVIYALLVPEATRLYLEQSHSTKLKNELYEALAGIRREGGEIQAAVDRADAISTKKDLARQLRVGFHPGVNAPIVVLLEKIMQELVENGTWSINQVGSPLWVTPRGVFLIWNRAVKGIESRICNQDFPALPRDSNLWKDKLNESSLVESRFLEDESVLTFEQTDWRILPYPELRHDCEQHLKKEVSDETPFVLNFLTALKLSDGSLLFSNIGKPKPVTVFIEGESLSDEEKALWISTSNLPITHFASKETMTPFQTPRYTNDEANAIMQATASEPNELSDFVIPEMATFTFEKSPYPDVPLNQVLKTIDQKESPQVTKETSSEAKPKLSVEDLLSPSQKAAREKHHTTQTSTSLDVNSHNKATVHAQFKNMTPHTHTDEYMYTDNAESTENKGKKKNPGRLKTQLSEKKAYLDRLIEQIKNSLIEGQGDLIEGILYRDNRIYSSTAPIERDLNAKDICFDSFIDKLHEFQTEPILSLTDNQDFVYIERK